MVPYKYIAPSGIQSTETEGRLLSVHNSTSKPPRLALVSQNKILRCIIRLSTKCLWDKSSLKFYQTKFGANIKHFTRHSLTGPSH